MSVMPVPTTPCPMCGGRECGWTPERVAREAAAMREAHPKFDEVWQVSAYQALNRMSDGSASVREGLEAALSEALSAAPEGWALMLGQTSECQFCAGWWATASKRLEEPPHYPHIISSEHGRPRGEHHDVTPAAALRALADRLATAFDR